MAAERKEGISWQDEESATPRGNTDISKQPVPTKTEDTTSEKLQDEQSQTILDNNSPISHLYLTFETNLPVPPTDRQYGPPGDPGAQVPPCPDLSAYTQPLTWSTPRKSVLLVLSCIATFLTAYTAGAYSPPATIMAEDFGTSHLVVLLGVTTFCAGFALAPMALAPMSEIWGRYPIFLIAGAIFVIFQAVCSVVSNIGGMLVARFFVGCGASVFSAVVGGVLADLWEKEERNTPMSLFSGSVLAGTGAGPLVSSALIHTLGDRNLAWKWTFWTQVILDLALLLSLYFFFNETRASVLLSRKAKKLNEWYEKLESSGVYGLWVDGKSAALSSASTSVTSVSDPNSPSPSKLQLRRIRWKVKADEQRASIGQIVSTSIKRPFILLVTEPIIACFSLWAAFSWGVLYLSFSVVSFIYGSHFNMSSRVYACMMVASVIATIFSVCQEQLLKHPQWKRQEEGFQYSDSKFWAFLRRRFPAEAPEARLYFACFTAMLLPIGLYIAFLASRSTGGYTLAVGIGLATWGIYSVYLATFNYLADSYHIYASSALASQSFCRNVLGGSFPLLTNVMFTNLGLRGAGGMLGGIATGLTVLPWLLMFYGEKIRAKSKFAISLQK